MKNAGRLSGRLFLLKQKTYHTGAGKIKRAGGEKSMKSITTDELLERMDAGNQMNIVDVREDDEVAEGMIPGAQHIKLGDVESRAGEFDKAVPYYIICRSGKRSGQATDFLNEQGIEAINVEGGMLDWKGETIV